MASVDGKKIDFTEDDFYKTLKQHDVAILKKFNDKDISDDDYFFCGINSDIMSNALSILINKQSGNIESIGVDNNCRATIEAFVILVMDAKGQISQDQKKLYRYQYALVDYDNFRKVLSEEDKSNDNYKELMADREIAIEAAIKCLNCTREDIKNFKFSADDPAFYLKKKINDRISFARLLSDYPVFDEKYGKIYEFFSLISHPRFEKDRDVEKIFLGMRKAYI